MTKTPDDRELDARIRELLGHAVARTPQPPALEDHLTSPSDQIDPNKRNLWMIGGGLGLGAAAAIAALLIVPNLSDQEVIQTPSDTSTPDVATVTAETTADSSVVTSSTSADETIATSTTTAAAPPTSAPGDDGSGPFPVDETTAPVPSDSAAPSTETTTPPSSDDPSGIVVEAGPGGIAVSGAVVTDVVAREAMIGSDGKLWFTPSVDGDRTGATVRSLDLATGETVDVEVPSTEAHVVVLHDAAVVQGEPTLLYTTRYPTCQGGGDPLCTTLLRTFQPGSGTSTVLGEQIAWEGGWGDFQLADNGLVVGSTEGIISVDAAIFNISSGVTPTLEALGLGASEGDCADCPRSFTIDRSGEHVAWIEGPVDDTAIVVVELQTGSRVEVDLADFEQFPPFGPPLQIAGVQIADGSIVSGSAVLTPSGLDDATTAPFSIDLADGRTTALTADATATIT